MPLVAIETMTSSVLREANNSLMAGQHVQSSSLSRENLSQSSQSRHQREWQDEDLFISDRSLPYDSLFSASHQDMYGPVGQKPHVLDFSANPVRANIFTEEHPRRTHSSPPEQVPASHFPPLISQIAGDNEACQSLVSFHALYTNSTNFIGGESSVLPYGDNIQMDVSLPSTAYSSRAGTPSSHLGLASKRESPCADMFSVPGNFDIGDAAFDRSYLSDPGKSDLFSANDFLNQEGPTLDFKFDTEQLGDSSYLTNNITLSNEKRSGKSPVFSGPALRRDVDAIQFIDSMDDLDRLHDSKYEDSDYSNTGSEHCTPRYSSPASHQLQHLHNNSAESIKYNFRQATSTPASDSMSVPSPSSHSASDSARASPTDTRYSCPDDQQPGSHQNGEEEIVGKSKAKGACKPRGAQNLPPCRVCGNVASGLHFGVNTCEACNEFFRRSLKRGATYYCSKNKECQVYGKKRNACSYCRYHRCVEMGMSRDAIKTGRYSHKTRTEYAMEVERFKQREVNRVEKEKYEILLADLVKYHDKFVKVTTRVPDEELCRSQRTYLEVFQSQGEHDRRHPPLPAAGENKKLLDDWVMAKEDLSLTMHDVEMTELWLRNYISFAKNVPGFKQLALSDQASLVRGSWFEFWFLGAFRGYNSSLDVVAYPNGRCFHREEIQKVFGQEYTDFSFYLADRMRSLDVTPEVMVLIKTVCLTFPDRTRLENKEAVDKMHWLMVSCLLHTLEKNKPGDSAIFPLVVSKLVELRTLTDIAMRAHKSALYQDVLKDKPLMYEMVDTTTHYVQSTQKNVVSIKNCV